MKALRDFNHLGISVKAEEEVSDDLFEPDDMLGLVAKGLIAEVPASSNVEVPAPAKEKVIAKRQRKDK